MYIPQKEQIVPLLIWLEKDVIKPQKIGLFKMTIFQACIYGKNNSNVCEGLWNFLRMKVKTQIFLWYMNSIRNYDSRESLSNYEIGNVYSF